MADEEEKPKRKGGKFKPGESGNPAMIFKKGNQFSKGHGRPKKLPKLDEHLANLLGEVIKDDVIALEIILKALRAKAARGDVKAATLLLDRAYGKALQPIEQTNKTEINLKDLTEEELMLMAKIQEKSKKLDESDS